MNHIQTLPLALVVALTVLGGGCAAAPEAPAEEESAEMATEDPMLEAPRCWTRRSTARRCRTNAGLSSKPTLPRPRRA